MFTQIRTVTWMNLRSIPQRLGTSLVIVIGIAGVVGVLISVLAMATGFARTVAGTGRDDRAIVIRGGSTAELSSTLSRDAVLTILDAAGVRHNAAGRPIGSAEADTVVDVPMKLSGSGANVTLRGVGTEAFELRPEIHLTAGRLFRPGTREIIVGTSAQAQFAGLEIGNRIAFRDSEWQVVGSFAAGDSHDSEILADADTVMSAYRRNLFQSVTVQLENAAAFETFKAALTTNPTLSVEVLRERDYFARQSEGLTTRLTIIGFFVGGIMAVGALFGALNTMYSAVSARSREIATLRAIGFGGTAVVISVFVEALALSLAGGVIGAALAWGFFNGNAVNTLGSNFTQVVFRLTVSPGLIGLGIAWACTIGLLGGLFPAIRAARLPVATALRAL